MTTERNPVQVHDVGWLRSEVVKLFQTATSASEPDVPSCTKLAELLFKLLPKGGGEKSPALQDLEEARRRIREGQAPS